MIALSSAVRPSGLKVVDLHLVWSSTLDDPDGQELRTASRPGAKEPLRDD
jgi:hypothetical protein